MYNTLFEQAPQNGDYVHNNSVLVLLISLPLLSMNDDLQRLLSDTEKVNRTFWWLQNVIEVREK